MRTSLLLILCSLILSNAYTQGVTGRIFELGNSKDDCQVVNNCDCCSAELFFLNEKQFAMIIPCTYDNDLVAGVYRLDSSDLILTFKQMTVTWGQREKDGKDFITKKSTSRKPMTFKVGRCEDDKILLERSEANDLKFGLTMKGLNEEIRLKEFLKSREWKLLNK